MPESLVRTQDGRFERPRVLLLPSLRQQDVTTIEHLDLDLRSAAVSAKAAL